MAGDTSPAKVVIDNVVKKFNTRNGEVVALNGVNLEIAENEFVCVVGPSGCGKSTLLNMISGLDNPTEGHVLVNGKEVTKPSSERGVVFQQYALFPWLTVRKNIEFGLKIKGCSKEVIRAEVDKYLKMVDLTQFENSYPKELSGGMKQRVAIARAYAVNPEVLLMDEPFGALDAQTKAQLQSELINTWSQEKKTIFFITHDVEEAVVLAQRIVIMSARPGRIREIINVNLPYPRDQKVRLSPEFMEIKNHIWDEVYEEYMSMRK